MSRTESYIPCLRLRIAHGYYAGPIPVRIVPDPETERFFRQAGWIFRAHDPDQWLLLRPEGALMQKQLELLRQEHVRLVFQVMPTGTLFHYVTVGAETEGDIPETAFTLVRRPGIWATLTIGLSAVSDGKNPEVTLRLRPPEKRLEFILIPRHTDAGATIRLEEAQGKLVFSAPEKTELAGEKSAYRITTNAKVELEEHPAYRFRLWEVRDSGERLLADRLPVPCPDQFSMYDPTGCVTAYFYY